MGFPNTNKRILEEIGQNRLEELGRDCPLHEGSGTRVPDEERICELCEGTGKKWGEAKGENASEEPTTSEREDRIRQEC